MSLLDPDLTQALEYTKYLYKDLVDKNPTGYSLLEPTNHSDLVCIRQHNTLIYLVLTLIKKVDNLEKQRNKEFDKSLEDITNKLAGLKVDKQIKKQPAWQFFQENLKLYPEP